MNEWLHARGKRLRKAVVTSIMIAVLLPGIVAVGPAKSYAAPTVFYASPTGSGSVCSLASPCSLTGVQAKVRSVSASMTDDIIVNLLGGTYGLSQTFVLSPSLGDSGANGHDIIYQANGYGTGSQAVPILSGGQTIAGWTLHDSAKNIWKANVGSLDTRQLYVNGARAFRARTTGGIPGTVTKTATGYTTTDTSLQSWANPADIEMVYHDGNTVGNWLWAEPRCPVASITGNASSTTITMAQPCFNLMDSARGGISSLPTWIENNYKALAKEGQFYLDRAVSGAHVLYYKPRSGQNMATATAIAPKLEELVRGDGTLANPLRNVQFRGLTFAYATWLAPNLPQGFPETSYNKYNNTTGPESQIGSAVFMYAVQQLTMEGNTFRALGGAGLSLDEGSRSNLVLGNQFYDISGNGIQIGNVNKTQPSAQELVTDNTVNNNYIHDIGREYPGAYGIWNAITKNSVVEHNTIAHLPRGGIAANYQYSAQPPSATSGNRFNYNKIYDYMNNIRDGGGFDTNGTHNGVGGNDPNSTLIGNVFYDNHNNYGQIYMDIWASGYDVKNNIAYSSASLDYNTIDFILQPCCNAMRYNFFDQDNTFKYQMATDMAVGNFMPLPISAMPASILQRAGLEPAYQYMLPATSPPADTQVPSAPTGIDVYAVNGGPNISVRWNASTDNVGVTGYEIASGNLVLAATTGSVRNTIIEGLMPGTTTSIVVRARDAAGNLSAPSAVFQVNLPVSADLVGHWPFENTATDTSGSWNNGNVSGAAWTAGKIGEALSFNGTNSSVNVGNAQILNRERENFTLTAWFKSSSTGIHQRILSKGFWGNTAGYLLWYEAGAVAFGIGGNGQQQNATLATTGGGLGDNNWHHVAVVVNRSAQTIQLYVDGTARSLTKSSGYCGTATGTTTLSIAGCPFLAASSNDPFTIGSYNGGYEFFSGAIDDVRVYARALSAADIKDVMSLVLRWKLDGTAEENRTNINPGTVNNGATWIQGRVGQAVILNGTNQSVNLGSSSIMNTGTGSFSIGGWFRSSSGGIHQRMISKGNWGNTPGYFLWYEGGAVAFGLGGGTQASTALATTTGGFNDGKWHHAMAVVNRSANTITIYVDGTAKTLSAAGGYCGSASGSTLNIAGCTSLNGSSGNSLYLGSHDGSFEFFNGALDDIRLYSRALTSTEVAGITADANLLGQWKFDEARGSITNDSSDNSAAGGIIGEPSWTAGKFGSAMDLGRYNSYVSMGQAGALSAGTGSFTLTTWFKSTSGGIHQRMVTKGNWGNSNGYFLWYDAGAVTFSLGGGGVKANTALVSTEGGFGDGAWHHAAAVVDRTAGTIKIYVDGTARALSTSSGYCGSVSGSTGNIAGCTSLNGTTSDPFALGSYNGIFEKFDGALDDVRLYNRALNQTEINAVAAGS